MKIQKFNESLEDVSKKIDKEFNTTMYVVRKYNERGENIVTSPHNTIEKAIESYIRTNRWSNNIVFITEEKKRILSEEEIELLINANKYNI